MKKPRFPAHFAGRSSDAIAVFKNGSIVYANSAFEKLYKPLKYGVREKFNRELHDVNLDLQQSGNVFTQKRITLPSAGKGVDVIVYLLNKFCEGIQPKT